MYGAKLVRDGIPKEMGAKGVVYAIHELAPEQFEAALRTKLLEEAGEARVAATTDDLRSELGDVLSVVEALATRAGFTLDDAIAASRDKTAKRGGFTRGFALDWTEE